LEERAGLAQVERCLCTAESSKVLAILYGTSADVAHYRGNVTRAKVHCLMERQASEATAPGPESAMNESGTVQNKSTPPTLTNADIRRRHRVSSVVDLENDPGHFDGIDPDLIWEGHRHRHRGPDADEVRDEPNLGSAAGGRFLRRHRPAAGSSDCVRLSKDYLHSLTLLPAAWGQFKQRTEARGSTHTADELHELLAKEMLADSGSIRVRRLADVQPKEWYTRATGAEILEQVWPPDTTSAPGRATSAPGVADAWASEQTATVDVVDGSDVVQWDTSEGVSQSALSHGALQYWGAGRGGAGSAVGGSAL
jgi:hypothetical protein